MILNFSKCKPLFSADDYIGIDYHYLWLCNDCGNEFNSTIYSEPFCDYCNPKLNGISKVETELFESINIEDKYQSIGLFLMEKS